jgi:hypothetical protein
MRDQWYGDKRDLVKWGVLRQLAQSMLFPTSVHLDTANPLSFFGLGAIEHFLVGVFLGNTLSKDGMPR